MKDAGSWVVDAFTREIRREMVYGNGEYSQTAEDGTVVPMQRAILYVIPDDAGRLNWCASYEDYNDPRCTMVWVTSRHPRLTVQAAQAIVMFTDAPERAAS